METVILRVAASAERLTDTAAIVIVACGVIEAFVRLLGIVARPGASRGERKVVWHRSGVWLLFGLEPSFPSTSSATSWRRPGSKSGQLGAVAVIRTSLKYLLQKDLDHADEAVETREVVRT